MKNIMAAEFRRDHTTIDVEEELQSSIKRMTSHNPFMSTKCCIFKIPIIHYRNNEISYVPHAFSIGPLHHDKSHPKDTEKIKLQYLHELISRAPTRETSLKNFIEAIRYLEGEARECYAVPIDFSADEFVEILVLDGCFIIELLRKCAYIVPIDKDDPVFNMSSMLESLFHDLILLENQIPWRVLDCLFSMTSHPNDSVTLTDVAIMFLFNTGFFREPPPPLADSNHGSKHILDLLRNMLVSSLKGPKFHLRSSRQFLSVTRLEEAGIIFKRGRSRSILDIRFQNGVLEIPTLVIKQATYTALRNLICFEQCYHNCIPRVTSYAILLQYLIDTTKDMNILHQKGILDMRLHPEEAIQFFNNLYHDTYVKQFYYVELCYDLHDYCDHFWQQFRRAYVHHFTNPWAIVSQVVGGIVLLLTFLQTIYSIIKK